MASSFARPLHLPPQGPGDPSQSETLNPQDGTSEARLPGRATLDHFSNPRRLSSRLDSRRRNKMDSKARGTLGRKRAALQAPFDTGQILAEGGVSGR